MELKEGMYVRFDWKKQQIPILIGKITEVHYDEDEKYYFYLTDNGLVIGEDNLIKEPSYNIIDLIEEHDILLLFAKEYDEKYKAEVILDSEDFKSIVDYEQTNLLNLEYELITEEHIKLLSIVTKEQFSQMEYKVGD